MPDAKARHKVLRLLLLAFIVSALNDVRHPAQADQPSSPAPVLRYQWAENRRLDYFLEATIDQGSSIQTYSSRPSIVMRNVNGDTAEIRIGMYYAESSSQDVNVPDRPRTLFSYPNFPASNLARASTDFRRDEPANRIPVLDQLGLSDGPFEGLCVSGVLLPLERWFFLPLAKQPSPSWEYSETSAIRIGSSTSNSRQAEPLTTTIHYSGRILRTTGDIVEIEQTIVQATDKLTGDQPYVEISGSALVKFDTDQGIAVDINWTGTFVVREDRIEVQFPVSASSRLASPQELQQSDAAYAARKQADKDRRAAIMAEYNRPLTALEIDAILAGLRLGNPDAMRTLSNRNMSEPPEQISNALVKMLETKNLSQRADVAQLLERWATASAVPVLMQMQKDENISIRLAAENALKRLAPTEFIQQMVKQLDDPTDRHKAAWLLQETSNADAVEAAVLKSLRDNSPKTFSAACEVLRKVGTAKSIAVLKTFQSSTNEAIRKAADLTIASITRRLHE